MKSFKDYEQLVIFAKAMAHPVRLEILSRLAAANYCYTGDLVDVFPLAQSTVSQHLKELKNAGLIQGKVCPPKVRYCLDEENWHKAKKLFEEFFKMKNQ